jgi:hypothetical protein
MIQSIAELSTLGGHADTGKFYSNLELARTHAALHT